MKDLKLIQSLRTVPELPPDSESIGAAIAAKVAKQLRREIRSLERAKKGAPTRERRA